MKIKKIISVILVTALCFTMIPLKVNAKEETVKEFKEIRTIDDLYGINNDPKGNYRLMNDIDMSEETSKGGSWDSGHGWTPLKAFSGELDGNGYRIKGMHIYGDVGKYAGMFSKIYNNGKVYNLGMTDVNIKDLKENNEFYVGAIAGLAGGTISNCYTNGNIVCPAEFKGTGWFGGIAGSMDDYDEYDARGNATECYNNVSINNVDSVSDKKKNIYIGGITANGYNISDCYNAGTVLGSAISDASYSGSKNYYLSGSATDGDKKATVLTTAQMSVQNMYVGFDFENTWEFDPNSSYKYPQLKGNRQQRVEGLSIESLPNKLIYDQGEDIDTDGGTVNIIYEGGYSTTILLTKNILSDYDMTETGTQNIKVNYGGKTVEFQIKINGIDVTGVSISGNNSIVKGDQTKLSAQVIPENATNKEITWSSSDESKAVVDAEGNVKAVAAGDVVITAAASNGVSASYNIKITSPCVLLIIDDTEFTLYKGDTKEVKPKMSPIDTTDTIKWSSSNKNIATVDDNGIITAISPGEATVTAKAGDSAKASCKVMVKQKLNSFYIVGVEDKTYTGNSIKQNVQVTDGNVTLKEKEDYKVNYSDNIEVGTATVTVSGLGFYEGTIKKQFNILSKSQKPDSSDSDRNNSTGTDTDHTTGIGEDIDGNSGTGADTDHTTGIGEDIDGNSGTGTDTDDITGIGEDIDNSTSGDKNDNNSTGADIDDNNNSGGEDIGNDDNTNDFDDMDKKITIGKTSIRYIKNIKNKKIEVRYKKVSGADGYQIRYSLKSDMSSSKLKVTVKTKYTITSLKKKKKYYVQVRAFGYDSSGKKVYGKWSVKKSIKINK